MRTIREIAREIAREWQRPHYAAIPYLHAMLTLDSAEDQYGADDGASIIRYFLTNARSFRGPRAAELKAELKAAL